jgi:hypothetical protein
VAVERPAVEAARLAAPIAGARGARMGVVGLGPAAALAALVEPRAGLEADLPGPARLPAAHQVSPPLAWLPGSDQPTKQAGTAKPEPHARAHRTPRREGLPGTIWVPPATRPRDGWRVLHHAPCPEVGPLPGRAPRAASTLRPLACSRMPYWAPLDAPCGPTSTPGSRVPSNALRRRAFSRSSSATLPSTSRRATRSPRCLARRALDELQAIPTNNASRTPSPAASSSSPWV